MTTDTIHPTDTDPTDTDHTVHGGPRALLRVEGLLVLAAAIAAYFHLDGGWGWLAGLFLLPDVALAAYLAGPRVGAVAYNAAHSYIGPALLAAVGLGLGGLGSPLVLGALIWVAHVGFDRALGYGLKHASGFRDTHLGRVGKAS